MTKLYLVRHGETVDNKAQIMQGQTPGELNMKGIEQAEEVARKMAGTPIDVFVSSDLYRSIQTCEIIAGSHPVVRLTITNVSRKFRNTLLTASTLTRLNL